MVGDLCGSGKQHPTDTYNWNLTQRNNKRGGAPTRERPTKYNACLGAEHGFGRGDGWRRPDRRRLVVLVIVRRCRRGGGDGSGAGDSGRRRRRSTLFENPLTLGQTFHAGQTVRGRRTWRVRLGQRRWWRRFGYSGSVTAAFAVYHINSIAPREAATTTARNEFFSIENNTCSPAND